MSFVTPDLVKIDSVGVGLTSYTNEVMNLSDTQYMVVGEFAKEVNGQSNIAYNMIVDAEGVSIRTSLNNRAEFPNEYALYVDGDVYVTGQIVGNSILANYFNSNIKSSITSNVFWKQTLRDANNIYYPNKVTLGNEFQATSNEYTLNITKSADSTIDHAQLAIQNTRLSQLRLGILGTARNSPAVINTPSSTAIEFHAGRDSKYFFDRYYSSSNYILQNIGGSNIYTLNYTYSDIPNYTSSNDSPHLLIDPNGHVGIHTSSINTLSYQLRKRNPLNQTEIVYLSQSSTPELHVEGVTYSHDILIHDYESASVKHIDELYVRRSGVTLLANQILPGPFALGDYSFRCNLSISGDPDNRYNLKVYGDANITHDLLVDGTTSMNQLVANDAILLDIASFCNDVYINRDMIVNQSVRLRGQIYVEVLSNVSLYGESNYYWQLINFSPASPSFSNINVMGQGISTPGRFGAGIDPTSGMEVNHQVSIQKNDPLARTFNNMFELELYDRSSSKIRKGAYIGHPEPDPLKEIDGSLIFATPSPNDPNFAQIYETIPQNFYFFPGTDLSPNAPPVVRDDNPPTLGIFDSKRVGLLTYNPRATLEVNGSIMFTSNLIYNDAQNGEIYNIGLWKSRNFANPLSEGPTVFKGLQYYNTESPYVGVNINPDIRYGMTVGGGFKADQIFNENNNKAVLFLESSPSYSNNINTLLNTPNLFTYGRVGIGNYLPTATLELKDNYQSPTGTMLKLVRGDSSVSPACSILLEGQNDKWRMSLNDIDKQFEIGLNRHSLDTDPRAIWMKYNDEKGKYQVVIGSNLRTLTNGYITSPDPNATLTVGGDMAVLGNVNITGRFQINTQTAVLCNVSEPLPAFGPDDVFIGGGHVVLRPATGKTVCVGTPYNSQLDAYDNDAMLRLYQPSTSSNIVATLRTAAGNAMIKLAAGDPGNEKILKFGIVDTSTGTSFAFVDKANIPFITFGLGTASQSNNRYVGYGNNPNAPESLIHIYTSDYGSNMLRLSKKVIGGNDTNDASPEILLDKKYDGISETYWKIKGPNAGFRQKLGLIYKDHNRAERELFSFTNDGRIGIGTSTPDYSLDIVNTGKTGTLRLLNTDINANPQLLFQTGNSGFGSDNTFDFRMGATGSNFRFDMQTVENNFLIMHVADNGNVGIRTEASTSNEFTIAGTLNVTETILLNGNPLFSTAGSSIEEGITLRAKNIFIRPNPTFGGGLVVNGAEPTGNLFHIYSGVNCNMMVYDSSYNEAQLHFRVKHIDAIPGVYNMYRMGVSNQSFYWEYLPNCGISSTVNSSHTGYLPVAQYTPSISTISGEFDSKLSGTYVSSGRDVGLRIINTSGRELSFGGSNGHAYIHPTISSNVGIGTKIPNAYTHIFTNNQISKTALLIQEAGSGSGNLLEIQKQESRLLTVNNIGNLNLQERIYVNNGTPNLPAYSFNSSTGTGIYSRSSNQLTFATNSQARFNVDSNGRIAIGNINTSNTSLLQLSSNVNETLVSLKQFGSADVLQVETTSVPNAFRIHSNGNVGIGTSNSLYRLQVSGGNIGFGGSLIPTSNLIYDIGSSNSRWRDIYLSGNTIDLGSTLIQRENSGQILVRDVSGLQRIIVKDLQIGGGAAYNQENVVILKDDLISGLSFTILNTTCNTTRVLKPITSSTGTGGADTVSIGTSNTTGALNVTSSVLPTIVASQFGRCNFAEFYNSSNSSTPALTINQNGNIGIGTTPLYPFNLYTSNQAPAFVVSQYGTGDIAQWNNNTGNNGIIFDYNGNIGIQTSVVPVPLYVKGQQIFDGRGQFTSNVYMGANLEVQGNSVTHGDAITDSDLRLKTDLIKIDDAIQKVTSLTGYTFTRIADNKRATGLIAQDVLQVLPEAVAQEGEHLGIAYGNMMGLIVEAIKDLQKEIIKIKKYVGYNDDQTEEMS